MTVPADLGARIDRLAGQLAASGDLTEPHWRQALHEVPRHLFVPAVALALPDGAPFAIDREAAPGRWWDAVYSNVPLVTQADDGAGNVAAGDGMPTSSCSAPDAVIDYLERLGPQPGDRVLEIGTGTGWTAALLCWRCGEENITSIEIDPDVASAATASLKAAGCAPRLVTGDGAAGFADGAPYDRVHSTCAVRRIPHAWVAQTRPGGVIVSPYEPAFGEGHLVKLHVQRDGTAIGGFPVGAAYMMMRSQRHPRPAVKEWARHCAGLSYHMTAVNPRTLASDMPPGACLAISAQAPGIIAVPGDASLWLLDAAGPGSSWASADFAEAEAGSGFTVRQAGTRRLWDEAVDAWFTWLSRGSPGRDRFGLTVTADGQHLWLDDPRNVITCGSQVHDTVSA